jgi:hypothetical protein
MAKFIKFPIKNAEALTGSNGSRDILVNVDDIESIVDGAAASSVVVTLKAGSGAGAQRVWTFTTSTSVSTIAATIAASVPIVPAVAQDMPSQSVNRALTANPGGVSSMVQLALDGAAPQVRMYFAQAAIA